MRRLFYIFVVLTFVMSSCSIDTSDNGDLDGFWHLERVDTLSTGGSCDLSNKTMFWRVQFDLLQLETPAAHYYLRFDQTSDSLVLRDPYINVIDVNKPGQGEDVPLRTPDGIRPFGIEALEVHYVKEALKGSRMILRSKTLRLYFRKF